MSNSTPSANNTTNQNPRNAIGGLDQSVVKKSHHKQPEKENPKYSKLQKGLLETLGSLSLLLIGIPPLQKDGLVMFKQSEPLAENLTGLAKLHGRVYDVLAALVEDSVYINLAMVVTVTALSIANNHGAFPEAAQERLRNVLIDPNVVALEFMAASQQLQAEAMAGANGAVPING